MTPTALLAASLSRIQDLETQLRTAHEMLNRSHEQFAEVTRIAETAIKAEATAREKLYGFIIQGGKVTKADAQIAEQIN